MKINVFRKSLAKKYGEGILDEFDTVYKNESINTLKKIGDKYGFSKVRASQIFKQLYGINYRAARCFVKKSPDPDEDISRGTKALLINVPVEMYRKLRVYTTRHGVSKASVVRDCLAGFLEDDPYSRIEL